MALPSSGQISLNEISVEAGYASYGPTDINRSSIRLLGLGTNQSGTPINFGNFHGKSAELVTWINNSQTISTKAVGGTQVRDTGIRLYPSGLAQATDNFGDWTASLIENWRSGPTTPQGDYKAKWKHISGDMPHDYNSANDTWMSLNGSTEFLLAYGYGGYDSHYGVFDVSVWSVGGLNLTYTKRVTLNQQYSYS